MRRIRVFVSSPGDCTLERQVLDEVVERINRSESDRTGLYLGTFKWEDDIIPRIGPPPQTVVDEQTPLCDIYLGIMSSRFGGDGTGESGTEQEFRQALERFGGTGQPWMLFYFNEAPPLPATPDAALQWVKVLQFRKDLETKGIVGTYSGVRGNENGFFERVDLHLRRLLQRPELTAATTGALNVQARSNSGSSATLSSKPTVPVEYLAWLQSTKCASVDLFGLEPKHGSAAKLHSIYVPLTTAPGAEDAGKDLPEGVRPRGKKKPSREVGMPGHGRERPTLLLDRLAKESLYVPGAPGSGKSTFCRWVTWLACEGRLPSALAVEPPEAYRETWPAAFANRLPVLVRLREFFRALPPRPGARDLARADLEVALAKWLEANTEGLSADLFRRHLAQGSALLVLDGVDEVAVATREGNARWSPRALLLSGLANACGAWTTAGNRVLVTSRPYGLTASDAACLGIPSAPVHDLDPPLRELLVRRWFQQLRPGGEGEAFAEGLIAHLHEHTWLEPLSVNPLLLTGMCIVYDEGGRLPQDKHDLYTRIVNTVLNSRYRDNVEEREKARYRLQAIAYGMHTGHGLGETRASPVAEASLSEIDAVLSDYLEKSRSKDEGTVAVVAAREELLSQSGLFLGRGDGKAGFYHLSFQEFLAGQRIADMEDDVFSTFHARAESQEWHNTLSLLFAGLTRGRAARLVSKLVAAFSEDISPHQAGLQSVAADCLDILHARGVRVDEAIEHSGCKVFQSTMVSQAPPVLRCRVGATLGRLGDPRFHDERLWCLPKDPPLGFVEIPAGPFPMGSDKARDSDADDDETPQHPVTLPAYYFARWPVTVAQFRAFVEDAKFAPGDSDCLKGVANHPVANTSWHEALAYCRWLTEKLRASNMTPEPLATLLRTGGDGRGPWQVTLPSEAEWEKAARGADGRIYPWGDDPDPNRANYNDTGIGGTSAVGCFPGGATPAHGVEELSGNVWERTRSLWGKDWQKPQFKYPYVSGDGREDLETPAEVLRVVRGGSFYDVRRLVRAAYRGRHSPVDRTSTSGFEWWCPHSALISDLPELVLGCSGAQVLGFRFLGSWVLGFMGGSRVLGFAGTVWR